MNTKPWNTNSEYFLDRYFEISELYKVSQEMIDELRRENNKLKRIIELNNIKIDDYDEQRIYSQSSK